jgi:nucleoside-diphosphate-sugar epimerase
MPLLEHSHSAEVTVPHAQEIDRIRDVEHLDDLLSDPPDFVVETLARLDGDLLVLGASGKMGPSLARMARRAYDAAGVKRRVIGVARFSAGTEEARLQAHGIETIRCDLLDPAAVERLPEARNVLFMAGRKFGSSGQEWLTWGVNCLVPALVGRRYRASRIVAFSTGNVYGMAPVAGGGSRETDRPNPQGEYAMSCLGRERVLEHVSHELGVPVVLIRLNYAVEMRYGVLVDLAQQVLAGSPIDLTMGYFNVIWQAHANAAALAALGHVASPPRVWNLTGPERLGVRGVAEQLGGLMGKPVRFVGREAPEAILSDSRLVWSVLPPPRVDPDRLVRWTADWIARGGPTLGKPTHFEVRDGQF